MKTTLATILIALALCVSAFARTKPCQIMLDSANKRIPFFQEAVADLPNFTDETRPSVEVALTAWIHQSRVVLANVCAAPDNKSALAVGVYGGFDAENDAMNAYFKAKTAAKRKPTK